MPISNRVDPDQSLVVTTAWGRVTDEDFFKARRELIADPGFQPSLDRLWDFSGVTTEELTEKTVGAMVATSPSGDHVRRAVVCTAPSTVPRVIEFITHSRELHRQIAVFPTRERAETWIQSQRSNDVRSS